MGTTTPIHDAIAEALRELQQDLDLAREFPVVRTDDEPGVADDPVGIDGDPADGDPTDERPDEPADEGPDEPAHAHADDLDDPDDGAGDPTHDTPSLAPTVAPDAEEVVALAWQEADERDHASFGTGHLLLGLVRAGGPEAGLLAAVGVTTLTAGAAMSLVASSSVSEPVMPAGEHDPVAGESVAEVLALAAEAGHVTATGVLTALLARPWGQAAEMLAALGVSSGDLATAVTEIAERPAVAPRPMPRDPSALLSSAWRRPVPEA